MDRVPPNNIEAEEALLGSLLIDHDVYNEVRHIVNPEDFYREQNRWIYESISTLREHGDPIDIVTVTDALRKKKQLEELGGEAEIIGLINAVPTSINGESYARIVAKTAARRRLLSKATAIANIAYEEDEDIGDQLAMAQASLSDVYEPEQDESIKDGATIATEHMDYLERAAAYTGDITGVPTGFYELDMFTGGLERSQMHIIAARPAMGKSAILIGMADHLAVTMGMRVMLFSMEMTVSQLMNRIIALRTGISVSKIRSGKLSEKEWRAVHEVYHMVGRSGLMVDETVNVRPSEIFRKASRVHAKEPIDIIMYDHLHLMGSDRYEGNPNKEVGDNTKQIFNIGKSLGVTSVVAAQLNRGVEDRRDKRPILSDLRDSGEIEQNAYSVMFLYRDDYYNGTESEKQGLAEINIAKYRDGAIGTIELLWRRHTASFCDIRRQIIA